MTDTTPPRLTSLSFPHTVNLLGGPQTITFTAGATDDSSGVEEILINFSSGLSSVFMFGTAAAFTTGTATAQDSLAVNTPPGTYSIASVDVYDNAGNESIYSTSALQGLGIATSISVSGSDTVGPTLTALSFDPTVDLSSGNATFHYSASATDRSGVQSAVLYFDGSFGADYLFDGNDSWSDGTSSWTSIVPVSRPPGVYHLSEVDLTDNAGNKSVYTTAQLQALNLPTTVTVTGSDLVGPTLTALHFDTTIDLSAGPATFHYSASGTDRSGIGSAALYFDGGLSAQYLFGDIDSWADGASASTSTIPVSLAPGVEHLTELDIFDTAGNETVYTTAQLQALGFPTTVTVSDSDVTGPTLTGFTHPTNVSLAGGAASLTLGVSATDRSGIGSAVVYFDKSLFGPGGSTAFILGSTADPWTDGSSTVVETIPTSTAAGVYTVTSLQVTDAVGNVSTYTTAQLTTLGYATTITVAGADTTPPQLTSLTFPSTVNVSAAAQSITFAAAATDNATGVKDVKLQFDKSFSGGSGPGIVDIAGAPADPWTDGASSLTQTLPISTLPGLYTLTSVTVTDGAGNIHAYTNAQLQALGVSTSLAVVGDTTKPTLTTLLFPASVDVSGGQRVAPFSAIASDNATGVRDVTVRFDKDLSTGAAGGVVDLNGALDSWSDGASTLNVIVPTTAPSGVYHVTEVDVTDGAGNVATYNPTQLAGLRIATSLTIVGGQSGAPTVTFSPGIAYSGGGAAILSGTYTDTVALSSVNVYSGSTFIGAASLNTTTHSWSLTVSLSAGLYTSWKVVATDVTNATATALATFTLQTGITGQAYVTVESDYSNSILIDKRYLRGDGSIYLNQTYVGGVKTADLYYVTGQLYTSYQYDYDTNGHYIDIKYFNYTGYAFVSTEVDYSWSSITQTYTQIEKKYIKADNSLYSTIFYNANGAQIITYYSIVGQAYTSYEVDYDIHLHYTTKKYFGYRNLPYVTTEIDFTWSSTTSTYIQTEQKFFRADLSIYETIIYHTDGTQVWTYYGVIGQAYTSYEYDYDASLHQTTKKYFGFTNPHYVETEYDYTWSSVTKTSTLVEEKFLHSDLSLYETIVVDSINQIQIWTYYGSTGQLYTSYEVDYGSGFHYNAIKYFGYVGNSYTTLENDYTWSSVTSAYTLIEQKYLHADFSLYETIIYNSDHTKNITFYGIKAQGYTSYETDYDAAGHYTIKKYFGYTGQMYVTIENDYTWSSTTQAYTLYEQEYLRANQSICETKTFNSDLTQVWSYYGITGQAYTSYEIDYNSSSHYTSQTYFGYTGQPYVTRESFYSWSSTSGYTLIEDKYFLANNNVYEDNTYSASGTVDRFYGITGQSYTSYEYDYNTSGTLLREIYYAANGSPNAMITHNADASTTYDYYQITGQNYTSYEVIREANGVERSQMANFPDGSHEIDAEENNITLVSTSGNDTIYGGGGSGSLGCGVLFQFNAGFGQDTIVDFYNRTTAASATLLADTIQLPKSEFADFNTFYADMVDSPSGAIATASNGDSLTLTLMTKSAVFTAQNDFKFV